MIFIDSNIWCYFFDINCKENEKITDYLNETMRKESIAINTVVAVEVCHFLVKNLGSVTGKKKIDEFINYSFRADALLMEDVTKAAEVLAEFSHTGIGGRDATFLASMRKLGIDTMVTHDSSFKKIPWLRVVDPVE